MNLQLYPINGETIAFVTLYGANRDPRVLAAHRRVMVDHLGLPINYISCPFDSGVSHGYMMNAVLHQGAYGPSAPTYWWWLDNDAILLRHEIVTQVYETVKGKQTLWGQSWNSSHKGKARGGTHPYASQACMCFSTSLYLALGAPDCDHHAARSDTAEEMTYKAEEMGFTVALQYPSHSVAPTVPLSQTCSYGRDIIYGPGLTYHCTRADLPDHVDNFVAMANRVLAGGFEPVVPAVTS